ncbi:MAG TPA: hypothetical protein VEG39_01415, partial [Clostridia bacterium]|nr:hypothetical protein [Clostridia bacterium]
HASMSSLEEKAKEKLINSVTTETNDYLKQILDQIKDLSDNVKFLNSRIDNLEGRNLVNKGYWGEPEELLPPSPITTANEALVHTSLNKSSFKEKFMKNEKTPNYDNLAIKQENITTFIGKPPANKNTGDTPQEAKAKDEPVSSEKQAYITPDFAGQDGTPYRSNGLIKKLGEFFK